MEYSLSHPYISVDYGGRPSYGGSQMKSGSKTVSGAGCGLVAGLDLLLYLLRVNGGSCGFPIDKLTETEKSLPAGVYNLALKELRRCLPLIPGHGINGLFLSLGLNAFFVRHRLPYSVSWGVPYKKLWPTVQRMLEQDLPVVFSIGPNFPRIWKREKLALYAERPGGEKTEADRTQAHYVTVTGMDERWLRISSWGRMFYIDKGEFLRFVQESSTRLFSNILVVHKKAV
ncbi:MAG: hypothetical protein K6G17_03615 [Oscillospiraceae bacterium]|nr:hypothetical protein [Oscillospiraceae bacterium]